MDAHCLEAQRYLILYQLCREGAYDDAAHKVGDLLQEMDRVEPKNAFLYDEFAKVFCRVVSDSCLKLFFIAVCNGMSEVWPLSGRVNKTIYEMTLSYSIYSITMKENCSFVLLVSLYLAYLTPD